MNGPPRGTPPAARPAPPVSRSPTQDRSYRTGLPVMSNQVIERKPNGQFAKGVSGNLGGNAQRSRHALNADTIREMHAAFRRGGRAAIDKVMKQQPAVFLKLLVLLVPRDMRVEHSSTIKQMSDEQIEQAIEAIQTMLAARAGEAAKVIEGTAEPAAFPVPNGQSSEAALEPAPLPKSKHKPNRLMLEADTEVGPTERTRAAADPTHAPSSRRAADAPKVAGQSILSSQKKGQRQ